MESVVALQETVAAALADGPDVHAAYAGALEALVRGMGWRFGAAWEATPHGETLRCVACWHVPDSGLEDFARATRDLELTVGTGLPGEVWRTGGPVWISDAALASNLPRVQAARAAGLHAAVAFPLSSERGIVGVVEVFRDISAQDDPDLMRALALIGVNLGLVVERKHSEGTRVVAERRHHATLLAALDPIVTMDHEGNVIEFNTAAERTFGYASEDVVGREMAELIVPPSDREAHRAGLKRYLAGGASRVLDRRIDLDAMHADGTLIPVELAITRIDVPGPPVFTAHLHDLRKRLAHEEELRASRTRIVEAADDERQRIERNLHDGAQQQLVSLAIDLRLAIGMLETDRGGARELLGEVERGLAQALAELRELARGIHPAVLTEGGLRAALPSLARRSAVPAQVLTVPAERLPPAVEAAAYYVVAEALTNVARHADASSVELSVELAGGEVRVSVRDDGAGGASEEGSGLRGLRDRVETLNGTLEIHSASGAGTTLTAVVPCAC